MSDMDEACEELLISDLDAAEVNDDALDVVLQIEETKVGDSEGLEVPEKDIVLDNYCVSLPAIHITIVKDRLYYLPLLQISIWKITLLQQVQPATRSLDVDVLHASAKALFSLAIDYYNDYLGVWEPLVELWALELARDISDYLNENGNREDNGQVFAGDYLYAKQVLNINAPQILDINVTQTSLLMTKRAIDLFGATDTEGDRAEKVKSVSRHDIANSLGFNITVWNEDSVLCPELATREIERVRRFKNFTIKALRKPWKRDGSISIEIPHGKREPLPFINKHADAYHAKQAFAGDLNYSKDQNSK